MPATPNDTVLALDIGARRVGVAIASLAARLPRPLTTLEQGEKLLPALEDIIHTEHVKLVVVGYPRGLQGQHTPQTAAIETFVDHLGMRLDVPIIYQDEAVTSRQAEAELQGRGKPYAKGDIDALAATYILEDYLTEQREGKNGSLPQS